MSRIAADGETPCAPHLIDVEVAYALRRQAKLRQLTSERAVQALSDLAAFPLDRYPHTALLPRAWELRDNITTYDAVYVALAETLDAPLITYDQKLFRTSGHKARIEVI